MIDVTTYIDKLDRLRAYIEWRVNLSAWWGTGTMIKSPFEYIYTMIIPSFDEWLQFINTNK